MLRFTCDGCDHWCVLTMDESEDPSEVTPVACPFNHETQVNWQQEAEDDTDEIC